MAVPRSIWVGGLRRLSSDARQRYAAEAHDVLGIAVTLFAIQHWFFARRSARAPLQKVSR
jgi:hypothetical protein